MQQEKAKAFAYMEWHQPLMNGSLPQVVRDLSDLSVANVLQSPVESKCKALKPWWPGLGLLLYARRVTN